MGLFKRMGDIISANLSDMVDKFEDPEKMLRQALREMEVAIADATSEAAKALANEKMVAKQLSEHQQNIEAWQAKAEQAVESGDDALARRALARKQEHEKLAGALGDQLDASKQASETLRKNVEAMKAKHAEAKRKLGTLSARKKAADARMKLQEVAPDVHQKSDAFAKFDRMREKVEMAEAEAEALMELSAEAGGETEPEFESTDELSIEAELAELKKKRRK